MIIYPTHGLAFVFVLVVGCGDNQDDAGARALLEKTRADRYSTWDRAPGYEARRPTSAPRSESVDIYVHDVVAKVLALGEPLASWPVGSIIAKDGFNGNELELTAVMEKRADGCSGPRTTVRPVHPPWASDPPYS